MAAEILVLEEDPPTRELLVETLEDDGYRVRGAARASEALLLALARRLDLVVAEVRREELEGVGALKARVPGLKVLVLTAYPGDEAPLRALSTPVDHYLFRPFELHQLLGAVRRVLGERRQAVPPPRFWETTRGLLRRAGEALARARDHALEADRDRVFRQFLEAVRSGALLPGPALRVWDRLEVLDRARQVPGMRREVREAYRYLADLVVALGRAGRHESPGDRRSDQVPRAAFQALYGRLRRGEVPLEQLKGAPSLRALADPGLRSPRREEGGGA